MGVLDDASKARGITLPDGTKSAELKGEGGTWKLVFQTATGEGEVKVNVPNLMRGMKILERVQAQIAREKREGRKA